MNQTPNYITTPFQEYIDSMVECYYDEYENIELIEKMVEKHKIFEEKGLMPIDGMHLFVWNKGMFVFQNPVLSDIKKEIQQMPNYEMIKEKPSIKNYLIGQMRKKYPYAPIDKIVL